jgi:uncharacterized protein
MTPATTRLTLDGAAGAIEVAVDTPAQPQGVAIIAHPHSQFGGTMDNKVVTTLARAAAACGLTAVRMNFRGVGSSGGTFDDGRGEADDFAQVCEWAFAQTPGMKVLGGFSFGAFVAAQAHARLSTTHAIAKLMLFGTAASRFAVPKVPPDTLVVHGEMDDVVPLASVLDWARPDGLPVVVLPGGSHFFDGRLAQVKQLASRYLLAAA